jgi:hypothetical protein
MAAIQPFAEIALNMHQHIGVVFPGGGVFQDRHQLIAVALAPLTLLKHYLAEYPDRYLQTQNYFDPYPQALALRLGVNSSTLRPTSTVPEWWPVKMRKRMSVKPPTILLPI